MRKNGEKQWKKKLTVIVMMASLLLVGCSKAEEKTVATVSKSQTIDEERKDSVESSVEDYAKEVTEESTENSTEDSGKEPTEATKGMSTEQTIEVSAIESADEVSESTIIEIESTIAESESVQEADEFAEADGTVTGDTYAEAYIKQIQVCEEENGLDSEWTYDLIYLDEDDIPELVAGLTGYFVNVYTWDDGKVYTLMDYWGYGAMGNVGYDYIPYENVVQNFNNDMAGAVRYVTYMKINENHEMESYYEKDLRYQVFKEGEADKVYEDDFEVEEFYFYYGEEEITEKEYDSYLIDGEYSAIFGTMTAKELIEKLQ